MPKLPTRSLIQLFGCLVTTAVVGLLIIFPSYRGLEEKGKLAQDIISNIRAQKVLSPIFREMMEKAKLKESCELVLVKTDPWPRERTMELLDRFAAMGRRHRMEVQVQLPDAASLIKQPRRFPVDMTVRGNFESFRPFFITLYQAHFVEHLEKISILTDGKGEEMQLKLWVAQK